MSFFNNSSSTLFSSNTLANRNTPLYDGGQTLAPSKAPTVPVLSSNTSTSITVNFDVAGIEGIPEPTYSLLWGPQGGPYTNSVVAGNIEDTLYFATFSGLTPGTTYQCKSVATNSAGVQISQASLGITTSAQSNSAPNIAPSVPSTAQVVVPSTSITVYINTAGITGTPAPTYTINYGVEAISLSNTITPVFAFGSLYVVTITGLEPSTDYYFNSVATNSEGSKTSATSEAITTSSGSGTGPSGPPTKPAVVGTPTSSSITVSFDTAGITGTPAPSFYILVGSNNTPLADLVPFPATLASGTIYNGTATGLAPDTIYRFYAGAGNGNPSDTTSPLSDPITTAPAPTPASLMTNVITPFLIQGPRFNSVSPWAGIDYYIATPATGAMYQVGGTTATGQQLFGSMYGGTVGDAGNLSGDPGNIVPYAGSCTADQVFNFNFGTISDAYLNSVKTALGSNGRVLASWGGFYADILGLFGPYQPTGYPGTNPAVGDVIKSFLYNYCGKISPNTNPLGWKRQNSTSTSSYNFVYQGMVLDFENVGNGNPLNNYPYTPPADIPTFPASATDPTYAPYIDALGSIPKAFYAIAPDFFLSNAPVSFSLIADIGTTNICASNSALNTWYAFPTATVPPTVASYIPGDSDNKALNHPNQMAYMDDIFVQFYNEEADYYPGGQYFANLLACWGWVALQAQAIGIKSTKINLGLARGNIIPGGSTPWKANAQGPTPPLPSQTGPPYALWYPQYCTSEPPNAVAPNPTGLNWPNTGPSKDPANVANQIMEANNYLQAMTGNPSLAPVNWLSGMGFWAGGNATLMAKSIYDINNSLSPANVGGASVLPHTEVYCWGDASYPAPNPLWPGNVPITANY